MVSNPESAASNAAASAASAEASEPETWAVPSVAGVSLLPAEVKPMGLAEASVDVENGLTESVEVPAVSASADASLEGYADGYTKVKVGSGTYRFEVKR